MAKSIEPVSGVTTERSNPGVDAVLKARERQAELDRVKSEEVAASGPAEEGAADTSGSRRDPQVRPYRVSLDPDTKRLTTEVLDRETGEVILRIPPRYVDPEDALDRDAGEADRKDLEA
ncbi:flagellar protein FlaG [Arenibaculum pallidiluteum]|uniref:flagellar protein FlaG n=1 Tax=Arenibaculum pallidiluteum TaxID=2812559 RepID=UPI001A968DB6|nr:hypothetical protein [Arenibaculum pallidiluteum]